VSLFRRLARRSAPARAPSAAAPVPDGVPELHRVTPQREGDPAQGPRLSLLLPTLNPGRTFGGTRTALDLFDVVASLFPRRRIVTFTAVSKAALAGLPGYERTGDRQVVALPRGEDAALPVGPDDVFLATFWTTAELAVRIAKWQGAEFNQPIRSFGYLVQDFEPGFYPWSAQWALARQTYAGDVPTIAVVNTSLLRDHLAGEGIGFAGEFTFEPRLAAALRPYLDQPPRERTRRIVVYGRPETPRNAFPLIVDGLREWARTDPKASGWTVESAGRSHPSIDLAAGLRLRSLGKLDLAAYGALLRESAVGLSLMISPHPSYLPLDMAHLGMLVATNRFAAKDLSTWHQNIRSLASLSAEGIAAALRDLTAAFEADPGAGDRGQPLRPEFLADGPVFPFAEELAERLKSGS
jgi:O-antigen biosynthesis protein